MAAAFLTAEWRHLVLFNFAVDPALLSPIVPHGTELDAPAHVSLVGFRFEKTRVLGLPVPFHRDFDEINLRFYVRSRMPEGWRRGVVFVREVVAKRAIAIAARAIYNEPYVTRPTRSKVDSDGATYAFENETSWLSLGAHHDEPPSWDDHIEAMTENLWGYTRQRDGGTIEYAVEHPRWTVWRASRFELAGDFARFYGDAFGAVLSSAPRSVLVADGSPVVVRRGERVG
ncbi:MAG TPA: DUF2071 domain-containing protein [Candidatus Polarisedimenticolaceae bacterium]|nr:DUF2071 domain-containing protein [Candidatus Polarisedimenticolaceae bacterium]